MQIEEHETTLNFDYAGKQVRIYTTRWGVVSGVQRRLGDEVLKQCTIERLQGAWSLVIPMKYCRSPELVCKVLSAGEELEAIAS